MVVVVVDVAVDVVLVAGAGAGVGVADADAASDCRVWGPRVNLSLVVHRLAPQPTWWTMGFRKMKMRNRR